MSIELKLLRCRVAGWLAAPEGESLASTHELLTKVAAHLRKESDETGPVGWQPIETAPKSGEFTVWLPSTKLAWPAYAIEGQIFSNSHGILNAPDPHMGRILRATHWVIVAGPNTKKAGERSPDSVPPELCTNPFCIGGITDDGRCERCGGTGNLPPAQKARDQQEVKPCSRGVGVCPIDCCTHAGEHR